MVEKIKPYLKFVVALAGVVSLAVTQGVITGDAAKWAALAVSAVTSIAVYLVPNIQTNPNLPPVQGG